MADLKRLQELLALSNPQAFNITAPENLQDASLESTPENDPMAFAPAKEEIPSRKLASQDEIDKIQAIPLPDAQRSVFTGSSQIPSVEAGEPEMSLKPSKISQNDILEQYRKLKAAQSQYKDSLGDIGMLQGGNQIAQALASRYGAKIGDGSDSIKTLKDMAQRPVDEIGENIKTAKDTLSVGNAVEMNDPASDISKMYREQAYSNLRKLNPDKDYSVLENMSAEQLKDLPGMKNIQNGRTSNRYVTVQDADGKVRSKLINMETGETIKELGLAGYAYGSQIDPLTGLPMSVSKSDPSSTSVIRPIGGEKPTASSQSKEPGQAPKEISPYDIKQKLNPKEREILNKDIDTFQNEIKDEKRIISEIGAISDSSIGLAKKNPNAAKTLGAQIAKIMQGSRLTDADVKLYTGQEGVLNMMNDFVTESLSGTISEDKARNIKQTMETYNTALRKSLENRAKQSAEITKQNFNPELGLDTGVMSKLYYIDDKKINKSEDKVKVKLPNGKVGFIPKANLQKAKAQGAEEIN